MRKSVEVKTGAGTHTMTLLPPRPDVCQVCATKHEPELPHNAQSLYYQSSFQMKTGRWPTWKDAMKHCTPALRKAWTSELKAIGVDVEAGQISPKRKADAKKAKI